MDEHCRKIKSEEIYSSSIASHYWFYNHHFDFASASIVSSPISRSHLNLCKVFYILKCSNNLINDFSSLLFISDAGNCFFNLFLQVLTFSFHCNFTFISLFYLFLDLFSSFCFKSEFLNFPTVFCFACSCCFGAFMPD